MVRAVVAAGRPIDGWPVERSGSTRPPAPPLFSRRPQIPAAPPRLQRPILLKGHERAITFLKYNREGDLIFTCSKDKTPCVWRADSGERLGTYDGHTGTIWSCDVTREWVRCRLAGGVRTQRLHRRRWQPSLCRLWSVPTACSVPCHTLSTTLQPTRSCC